MNRQDSSSSTPPTCIVCRSPDVIHFRIIDDREYYRCTTCQATFLTQSQMPDRRTERTEYSLHENDPRDPGYQRFLSRLVQPLLKMLAPESTGLDYGCGPGPALPELFSGTGHVIHLYDPIFRPDSALLNRTYDFVTCTEVVEHFHSPAEEFSHLNRLLKSGGWLGILTCFQTDDAAFEQWHYRRDPTHVVFYREATFQYLGKQYSWQCHIPEKDVVIFQKP